MSRCALPQVPFKTRSEAKKVFNSVEGAFTITKLTNDPRWYYIISKVGSEYFVNFTSGSYQIPEEDKPMFDELYSRVTTGNPASASYSQYYITIADLENDYVAPNIIKPKNLVPNINCQEPS